MTTLNNSRVTRQVDGDGPASRFGQSLQGADAEPVLRGEADAVEEQHRGLEVPRGRFTLSVEERRVAAVQLHGPLRSPHSRHPEDRNPELQLWGKSKDVCEILSSKQIFKLQTSVSCRTDPPQDFLFFKNQHYKKYTANSHTQFNFVRS